jgi:hypothetical protein
VATVLLALEIINGYEFHLTRNQFMEACDLTGDHYEWTDYPRTACQQLDDLCLETDPATRETPDPR